MMTKKPDFGDHLRQAQERVTPQRRDTTRRSLKKSALEMGSTGEEVLKTVLADSGENLPAAKPKERQKKLGFFGNLLSIIGLAAPHIK